MLVLALLFLPSLFLLLHPHKLSHSCQGCCHRRAHCCRSLCHRRIRYSLFVAQITPALLGHFIALGQFEHDDKDSNEPDLAVFAAFSFPGVLKTLGASRWSELQPLFSSLSRDSQKKVRIPLSFALHEVGLNRCLACVLALHIAARIDRQ
jgi:hypothetical protein